MSCNPVQQLAMFGPAQDAPAMGVEQAIAWCRRLATRHYENFSVLSALVPRELRDDFAAVYAFCRWADDLGDEVGDRDRALELLAWWRRELQQCFAGGELRHPVFIALRPTIRRHELPIEPFDELIRAFEQDQTVTRYDTWEQALGYCRLSANPVGRLVLMVCGEARTDESFALSDSICTALQLTNHWQDVRRDALHRDRIYIPRELWVRESDEVTKRRSNAVTCIAPTSTPSLRHSVTSLPPGDATASFEQRLIASARQGWGVDREFLGEYRAVLRECVERTWSLYEAGLPLLDRLHPRTRPVVWLFAAGGGHVLRLIEMWNYETVLHRPTLSPPRKLALVARAWLGALRCRLSAIGSRNSEPRTQNSAIGSRLSALGPQNSELRTQNSELGHPLQIPKPLPSTAATGISALSDDAALRRCEAVTRRRARNFYYGLKLLPGPKRLAMYALYAWMRQADDLVDDSADSREAVARSLERYRRQTHEALAGVLPQGGGDEEFMWRGLALAARQFPIPIAHFDDMLDGQLDDALQRHYQTFEELREYCYRVASSVGLVCIEVWGYTDCSARMMAIDRGIAFQLTNILRDFGEDAREGRVYLPSADLAEHGLTLDELRAWSKPEACARLVGTQVARAESYYARSARLDALITPECRPALWAMTRIYRGLLERIKADPRRIALGPRVRLGAAQKAMIALRARLGIGIDAPAHGQQACERCAGS
jgi:squalene synthase HpnC